MSGARRASARISALVAAATVLALIAPAAGAQGSQEPRLPRELWKAYPLDPTKGEPGEQSTGTGGTTTTEARPRASPTAAVTRETPRAGRGGSVAVALAAALGGLAGLLVIGFAVVLARRRGRLPVPRLRDRQAAVVRGALGAAHLVPALAALPARRLATTAGTVRLPRLRVPQRLRSESGSLVPLARPLAQEKRTAPARPKKVSQGEAPPQKPLPGLAPPPAKERQVRSGLPPGKTVPLADEPPPKVEPVAIPTAPEPKAGLAPVFPHPSHRAKHVEPRRPARGAAGVGARVEECEIDWWRGYVKSDFFAYPRGPGRTAGVLARSPSFRWRSADPPLHQGSAAKAHAALLDLLAAEGWELIGTGSAWYQTRLRRPLKPTLRDLAGPAGGG